MLTYQKGKSGSKKRKHVPQEKNIVIKLRKQRIEKGLCGSVK